MSVAVSLWSTKGATLPFDVAAGGQQCPHRAVVAEPGAQTGGPEVSVGTESWHGAVPHDPLGRRGGCEVDRLDLNVAAAPTLLESRRIGGIGGHTEACDHGDAVADESGRGDDVAGQLARRIDLEHLAGSVEIDDVPTRLLAVVTLPKPDVAAIGADAVDDWFADGDDGIVALEQDLGGFGLKRLEYGDARNRGSEIEGDAVPVSAGVAPDGCRRGTRRVRR